MCCGSRVQQGEERTISFPGKDSANANHRLFVYWSSLNLLCPSTKVYAFPCPVGTHTWLATLQNLNYNSLLILRKSPHCWGNIWQSVFQVSILVTHLGTREDSWGPWDWWADLNPLSLIAFLTNPGVQTYAFLLDLSLQPACVWSSPGVIWGLFKGFDSLVKILFSVLVLFWHFHLILRSDCFNW